MSAMLGRSGTWYDDRPCGRTSRFMRRSGRQREQRATELEIQDELELVVECNCRSCSLWGDPWPFG